MTTQDSSIYSDPAVRAAICETIAESATSSGSASDWIDDMAAEKAAIRDENREAAAAEAADEAVADGATREQAREVYARTLTGPQVGGRWVVDSLDAIASYATRALAGLAADRIDADGLDRVFAAIGGVVAETQRRAGTAPAAPAAWTLETAPAGTLVRIPAGRYETAGGFAFTLDAATLAVKTSTHADPDRQRWTVVDGGEDDVWSTAELVEAGAVIVGGPQPVAETPADDSPAGQLLHAARVAAVLIERLGDRIYRPNVRRNEIGAITGGGRYDDPWAGGLRYLANLRECVSILGATVTARITATGGLTVAAKCVIDGVDVRIAAPLDPGSPAEPVARAWLAELGVEVQS